MSRSDPIAAIATAPGRAAIGIVRLSGPDLRAFGNQITGRALEPRQATRAVFRDGVGEPIDEGIALYFPAPGSYTGEDVLELQGHGGMVVLRTLLERCVELGARIAEPGEFTQRAFLNGKIDLVQAEGVIDLIDASTGQAARSALKSLQGEFSTKIQSLNAQLIELRALVEATLDFPEEEIDPLDLRGASERLARLRSDLEAVLAAARQGSLLREGLHIVLAGRPNVGKSSLLNRLAGGNVAIVTEIPGTTRDVIREAIDIDGVPVHILDTAGLRDSTDPVERIGVERAWGAIGGADLLLLVSDAQSGLGDEERAILARVPPELERIHVVNKIDLTGAVAALTEQNSQTTVLLSAKTGAGVDLLREAILARAGWAGQPEGVFLARERHLSALQRARDELSAASARPAPELFAEHLRLGHEALMSITGEFGADDLLGAIFQRFCIGK
ncbi:MAG TPA: tRNA uridine-5-carboxymethylaminomethyl(34) synthesis GTPase MnmE [Burkholderiales bacterium]|nr:tRNA uridine-5-carboxymethylaminomethyl(34) synthesis GTPase MnmE [Burkholderiales bacterium]